MEKDKLLDYMFAQNSRLTDQLAGVSEELRLQREQADIHHKDLKSSLARMEEHTVAAEKRVDMEAQARAKTEEQVADLMKVIDSFTNDTPHVEGVCVGILWQIVCKNRARLYRYAQHAPHEYGSQC